jgi:hypothetical protein
LIIFIRIKVLLKIKVTMDYSFETRDPANPELELDRVEEKIEEGKTRCDPVKNPVATR